MPHAQPAAAAGAAPARAVRPGSALYEQPVLVVSQKTKLIELTNEYAVFDGDGQQIGAVVQVGQSSLKKAFRLVSNLDQFLTHRLEVRDATGPVLLLTRPAKVVKSRVLVEPARRRRRSARSCRPTSSARSASTWSAAASWSARSRRRTGGPGTSRSVDAAGTEVARITKTWEGLARTLFTTADNYVVQVH